MIKKIILSDDGNSYFVEDLSRDYHTQQGYINKKDMKRTGRVKTSKGKELSLIDPSFVDLFSRINRHAQIITLKDIGLIIANTGINSRSVVVDLGSGSGALACFLANIVKNVTTYDIDDRSINTVKDNINLLGLKNIKIKKQDCYSKLSEKNADLVTMDLPEPWKALENARKALKIGGFLVNYSPHATQAQQVINEAKDSLAVIKTVELIEREWVLDGKKARPGFKGLGHTGFLTFLRRIN